MPLTEFNHIDSFLVRNHFDYFPQIKLLLFVVSEYEITRIPAVENKINEAAEERKLRQELYFRPFITIVQYNSYYSVHLF